MIEGTRKLSPATNERLLSLIEQLVKDTKLDNGNGIGVEED